MITKYLKNEDGNVAMMFGAAALMFMGLAGFVVDYGSMSATKTKYQSMSDAAVLAAAGSGLTEQDELQALAEEIVAAHNFSGEDLSTILSILDDNTLRVEVSATKELAIMSMFGAKEPMIRVGSEAPPKGEGKLNLALVLDVTDSMEGTKIDALKTAASDLVNELTDSDEDGVGDDGETMISVVPFARYVQLPLSTATEPWLEITLEEQCTQETDWDNSTGCVDEPYTNTWTDDSGVVRSSSGMQKVCTTYAQFPEVCTTPPWNGCVGSRDFPWNTRDYVGPQLIPGRAKGMTCDEELLPLTNDVSDVLDKIDDLNTNNKTYIPSGLVWGWRALTDVPPFTEANTADKDKRKSAMLLMSDGGNTRSLTTNTPGGFHWNEDIDDANSVTETLCTNIKAGNIVVYTVAFEVTDADTISLLTNCATDTNKFFDASNISELKLAFEDVGKDLAQIRLSK